MIFRIFYSLGTYYFLQIKVSYLFEYFNIKIISFSYKVYHNISSYLEIIKLMNLSDTKRIILRSRPRYIHMKLRIDKEDNIFFHPKNI